MTQPAVQTTIARVVDREAQRIDELSATRALDDSELNKLEVLARIAKVIRGSPAPAPDDDPTAGKSEKELESIAQ